jgi:hypothetical protein
MVFPNPGADRGCGPVTIIGGEIGTSRPNKKIIDYEQQGTLTLIGNKFSGARGGEVRVVATASPRGFVQTLNFEGDTWGNVTLGGTTPGSIIGTNYQMQCFEAISTDWCPGVSHYIANHRTVFDGLNLQIMRGALTQSNGTTTVTQYVNSGGYRFDSPNATLLGGFNVGSSGATGAFLAGSFYSGAFNSSTANRAHTGLLNAASSDRALAFRNSANTADISAVSKDAADVVQVGDSPGAKVAGPFELGRVRCSGLPTDPANGWLLYCSDCKNVADDSARPGAPCAPGGHGALAKSENSRWDCN